MPTHDRGGQGTARPTIARTIALARFILNLSVATASATAYAAAAGGSFSREKDVLVLGNAQRVPIRPHGDIREGSPLPRLHVLAPHASNQ